MLEAFKALLSSKKFLMAIIGVIATAVGKLGFELDTEAVMAIVSPLIAAIIGQGVADHGKSAVQASAPTITVTRDPNAGFAKLSVLVVLAALGLAACGWLKSTGGKVADHAIDCTTAQAVKLYGELGSVVRPAVVAAASSRDYDPLKALLRDASAGVTGCLVANVTADVVKAIRGAPRTQAQQLDADRLLLDMRIVLATRFGSSFKTQDGAL